MKLICSIKPRADGTIRVSDGANIYTFTPTADGQTAAEVPEAVAVKLLVTGNFYQVEQDAGELPVQSSAQPAAKPAATRKAAAKS